MATSEIETITLGFLRNFLRNGYPAIPATPGTPGTPARPLDISDDEYIQYFELIRDRLWDTTTHTFTSDLAIKDGPSHITRRVQEELLNPDEVRFPNLHDALDLFQAELSDAFPALPLPSRRPMSWSAAFNPFIWGFLEQFGQLFTTTEEENRMIAAIEDMAVSSDRIRWIAATTTRI